MLKRISAMVLMLAGLVHGATPSLSRITPPGAQRGTELELTLSGGRLGDAQEILFYTPGIAVSEFKAADGEVKAKVKIAADARMGEHQLRVRTASGVSELRTFYVGAYPMTAEKEPNSDFKAPQKVELNQTITGVVENEDVDYFLIEAKKGQRITAEVEGIRLGRTLFDPYIAILDTNRFELAASDDSALLLQDPVVSIVAPADGMYIIQLRETAYGGDGNSLYRLHLGTFPRPRAVFPPGGQVGQELAVQFIGDPKGPIRQAIKLPAEPDGQMPVYAEQEGQVAPSANYIRVSGFPSVNEAEPNNEVKTATAASVSLIPPLAFNGVIGTPGDNDVLKFTAKKGQNLDVHVYARRLRSPLDPILSITNASGGGIASNDDSGGPDSYVRFNVPADGEYCVHVRDHLLRGGEDFVYRVEITPAEASYALSIPEFTQYSQERNAVAIPKGNRFATLIRVSRQNFGGDLTFAADDLPKGVSIKVDPVHAGLDPIPVIFEAAADAPVAGNLVNLLAKHADPKQQISGGFRHQVELVYGGNNTPYYGTRATKLPVVVCEEAPFKLQIAEPKAPLVQNGEGKLRIVAERKEAFKAPINVRLLWNPPGVNSGTPTIPEGQNEVMLDINASGGAQTKAWKIIAIGSADVKGPLWVASDLAKLEVASPFIGAKIDLTKVQQAKETDLVVNLEQKTKFEGKAKAELKGLPANSTAEPVEVTAGDSKITFKVKTTDKTPTGQHKQLFARVQIQKEGEDVIHNVAQGGILRVDPPPKPSATQKAGEKKTEVAKNEKKEGGGK